MDFLTSNLINTTTMISVNSNTTTVSNLFNRDPFYQYYSDGLNNDSTTCSINITFDATTSISRIALIDTNAKRFNLFYNGSTANSIALDGNGSTSTASWTSNTESNIYLKLSNTISVSSITLDINTTQSTNDEKHIGLLYIGDNYYTLTQIPSANNYDPKINPKQIIHTLSDGGTRIHTVRRKKSLEISLDYISSTIRDNLESIYNLTVPFQFCPFGTTTSWDGFFFECVWTGSFDFYQFSDNAAVSGYSGKISLKETPF